MERKTKISKEIKVKACQDYLSGQQSVRKISHSLFVNESSVKTWIGCYREHGKVAFDDKL